MSDILPKHVEQIINMSMVIDIYSRFQIEPVYFENFALIVRREQIEIITVHFFTNYSFKEESTCMNRSVLIHTIFVTL